MSEGRPGRVYLVGAGPGDPGLLTARALEAIARADVILYDRLVPIEALEQATPGAEFVFVGKQGGGPSVPQQQTQALMIERAKRGLTVTRLKGGDPFVFGRGGEEALALREQGIPFEVVPGVSAGVAAPAYAGIPVTHRGLSAAVALITGSTEDQSEPDWPALAAFPGTLVFYMGISALPSIVNGLIAAGRPGEEPAAVIERGTLPDQRTVTGSLREIAQRASEWQIKAPAITVVGAVAKLAEQIDWRAIGPLGGKTVAVTRAQAQASSLARRLRALGAAVIQAPAIRIVPLPGPPLDPSPYDLICLTSPNGVELLFERIAQGARDARALAGARIAAIGPGTAAALERHGITADVVPQRFVAESLAKAVRGLNVERALIARAAEARDVLPDALRKQGAEVDVLALYETVAEPLGAQTLAAACKADYITFTSSSTVRLFLQSAGSLSLAAGAAPSGANPASALPGANPSAVLPSAHPGTVLPSANPGTVLPSANPDALPLSADPVAVAATPASAAVSPISPETKIVSIGPVTSDTLREHGLAPHVEAQRHDIDGLIEAIVADASAMSKAP